MGLVTVPEIGTVLGCLLILHGVAVAGAAEELWLPVIVAKAVSLIAAIEVILRAL